MADKLVYSSSGSHAGGGSSLRRFYDKYMGTQFAPRAKHHLTVGGEALRAGGESLIVGSALGAIHASMPTGLDIKVSGKTAAKPVYLPADAVVAAIGLIGSAAMGPNDAVGTDLRNSGAAAASVFAFRKTADYIAGMRSKKNQPAYSALSAHGENDWASDAGAEDPIVAAARHL